MTSATSPSEVLEFWFPAGLDRDLNVHRERWMYWMRGGADQDIIDRFADLTESAARGDLDDWAASASGRMALVLVLDQFSRSVFRESPRAFEQDTRAVALVHEGISNGHYAELHTPWEKTFFGMPLVHAEVEGIRTNAELCVELAEAVLDQAPPDLRPMYEFCAEQARKHRRVIRQFGRHPHRNSLLGRRSTPDEADYLERGVFPHEANIELSEP